MNLVRLIGSPWRISGDGNHGSQRTAVWSANGDYLIASCASPNLSAEQNRMHAAAIAQLPDLVTALLLIAGNTCCERCQEAALVARVALLLLNPKSEPKE